MHLALVVSVADTFSPIGDDFEPRFECERSLVDEARLLGAADFRSIEASHQPVDHHPSRRRLRMGRRGIENEGNRKRDAGEHGGGDGGAPAVHVEASPSFFGNGGGGAEPVRSCIMCS